MERYVPEELRIKMPWLLWQSRQDSPEVKATKLPIDPHTGRFASVSDSATWGAFELCYNIKHCATGLGIVLLKALGYTCIDLDETDDPVEQARHQTIIKAFNSYTEYSQSGKGYHIWVRGVVPTGRRRGKVEIYSDGRYMATTGNIFLNVPIRECQELLMQLWEEMEVKEKITSDIDNPEVHTDTEVLTFASSAMNGQKFIDLFEGRWQLYYDDEVTKVSCNEADFALINILAHYTQNRNQITRLFLSSALGKREKAKRTQYVGYMLSRAFDRIPPPLNLDALHANLQFQLAAVKAESVQPVQLIPEPPKHNEASRVDFAMPGTPAGSLTSLLPHSNIHISKDSNISNFEYTVPPGLCGDICRFIHDAAPRPVPEIAIAGAIGLMSGICGRSYNVSGTGLNNYIFLLAKTGRGKEAMGSGIGKLINAVIKTVPAATVFSGPSKIASSEALLKYISKTSKCFLSIMGEFADSLKRMSNDSRNPVQQGVRQVMLDLYNKSGNGNILGNLIYSDKDKNTEVITAPAFSILGEATPEKFYELLSKDMITEGLLPRFCIIEYGGHRVQLNKEHHKIIPSQQLTDRFAALCAYSLQLNNGDNSLDVSLDSEAQQLFDDFDTYCDKKINNGSEINQELWNRAHIKALKIAALLAVGCNYIQPLITSECANWALNLVINDVKNILSRFESGEVGLPQVQNEQFIDIHKAFKKYMKEDWRAVSKYAGSSQITHENHLVPHSFITANCRNKASFKADRMGPVNAIKTILQSMIESGDIQEVSPLDKQKYNLPRNGKIYALLNLSLI